MKARNVNRAEEGMRVVPEEFGSSKVGRRQALCVGCGC